MKIISNFKDYYDGVVNTYGIDEHVIFIRDTKELISKDINFKKPEIYRHTTQGKYSDLDHDIHYDFIYIGFCGLIYPCLKKTKIYIGKPNNVEFEYNYQNIKDKFHELYNQKTKWVVKYYNWNDYKSNLYDYNQNLLKLFNEHKCSSFLIDYEYTGYDFYRKIPVTIMLEPILKQLQFFKIKSAFDAFKDVSIFVAEQLNTEIDTFVMSDKQKILSRGFDEKYGFRKRPK